MRLAIPVLLLAGCAAPQSVSVIRPAAKPLAPRVVAFLDSGVPQATLPLGATRETLHMQLEQQGFEVRRFVDSQVPYGIELRGVGSVCGDGLEIDWLDVSVVDLRANRTVYTVRASGRTEGCFIGMDTKTRKVWYGTLFADVARELARGWGPVPAPPPTKQAHPAAEVF